MRFVLHFTCLVLLTFLSFQPNANSAPWDYYDTVQRAYIGYYQRPADPGGLLYWAGRLDESGGNLHDIIEAFANSEESQALYGAINSSTIPAVINGIYNALFNRDAEPGGLDWYVKGFNSSQYTAATIMLNVLYGAQNEDLQSITNKLSAANLFTKTIDPELDGLNFLVTYAGEGDAIKGRGFLASVTDDGATVPSQDAITTYMKENIANPGDLILKNGTAPTITSLFYDPSSAQLDSGGGAAIVTGTVDFTDPEGDISGITIEVFTSTGQKLSATSTAIEGVAGMTSGSILGSLIISTTAAGNYTFEIFVADATGRISNRLSGTFSVVTGGNGGGSAGFLTNTGSYPAHLVADNGVLFWSETSENPVQMIPLAGGSPVALAQKMGVPAGFAVLGQDVFWLEERSGVSPSGCAGPGVIRRLNRTSLNGGATTLLATGDGCAGGSTDVVVDGGYAYWVSSTASPNTYTIRKTPTTGGASATVTTTSWVPIVAIAGTAGTLYWMENNYPDSTGAIRRIPTSGGETVTLASGFTSRAGTFAINSASIFHTEANFPSSENLIRVPLNGDPSSVLAVLANTPGKLAADDTSIYWIDSAGVSSLPVAGGSPLVLANAGGTPLDLLLRGTNVLWTETNGPAHGETGTVKSVPKTGGTVTELVKGGNAPRHLGGDASSLYWTEGGDIGLIEGYGRIARIPAGGGSVETVVAGVASDSPPIAVTNTHVIVADKFCIKKIPISGGVAETIAKGSFYITDLVADGAYVYWVEDPQSVVFRALLDGGDVSVLATVTGVPAGPSGPIRLHNGTIYWMTHFDAILSVPAAGGMVRIVASGLPFLSDFVVDESNIYFSEMDTGNIKKMPVAGGDATALANSVRGSYIILAVDGASLYWIDQVSIGKAPKTSGGSSFVVSGGLASDPYFPASLALEGTSIYWTEPPLGEIHKTQK